MRSLLISSVLFNGVFSAPVINEELTHTLPNSCTDLEDGEHYLKLLESDEYPVVLAKCSNGYTMIDYSLDNDWSEYFTSFLKWHYQIGGANQRDHVNWAEWYLPDSGAGNTNFLISQECDVCDESVQEDYRNTQGLQSGYYMNANLYGCFTYPRGMPDCDFDITTMEYECRACYTDNFSYTWTVDWDSEEMTDFGACMNWIRGAYDEVDRTFDECTDQTENGYKPTIGIGGRFCVCTKPETSSYFEVSTEQMSAKKQSLQDQADAAAAEEAAANELDALSADDNTFYLTQKDFEKGTLRIKTPGTYILMEDIEFDWNAGTKDSPNADGAWFPFENDEDYPGYGTSRDLYFMGFFAGITIETNNVEINLNGHEMKQSKEFFYQQGFFSVIEVESQPFIPGQGVGFFGSDPVFPENVVIRNGNIGRTSHHCIHGNYNKNLLIEDINCYDFSTHGIQLNGFDGITLRNVDIGPSNTEQFLSSEYTHFRFILPRLRKIAEEHPTETIQFVNRDEAVNMYDIVEELERKMDMAYNYVMYDESYEEDDELYDDFVEAKTIFVSEHGLGYGGSQYGLFLSYPGANVLSYHLNTFTSNDATIENVKIHDIHHQTKEYTGLRTTLRLFVNSFNAPLHLRYLVGDTVFENMVQMGPAADFDHEYKYVGNIITDATFAMSSINQDDWGMNQIMFVLSDELTAWAKGEIDGGFNGNDAMLLCAVDGMIHSAKGTFGLRIDGVDDVKIDGLEVENIEEDSPLGYGICGHCNQCAFESRSPYQKYYTGNMVQGISIDYATPLTMKDVSVKNVHSKTGKAYGISLWPGIEGSLSGDITVENINAGSEVDYDGLSFWQQHPSSTPDACAIQVYDEETAYDEDDYDNDISSIDSSEANVKVQCVSGFNGCFYGETATMIGSTYDCDGNEIDGLGTDYSMGTSATKLTSSSKTKQQLKSKLPAKSVNAESLSQQSVEADNEIALDVNVVNGSKANNNNNFSSYVIYGVVAAIIGLFIGYAGFYGCVKNNKRFFSVSSSSEVSPLVS